ncbi:MAG: LemA family protein [Chitinophagaceae bacterium]|nr:LemA family protein [Chitinophagaceae bacterium]MBK8951150.1 LemA family protein [Chitinophagaceae bacterium]
MPFIIVIIAILIITVVLVYNNLIRKKNAIDNAFFSMDVMLKKRYDLIPQLVETVKGYMYHEREVLTQLTELRQQTLKNHLSTNEKVGLDNEINSVLQKIFVSFENYPELKASENFLRLQGSINEAEEQLAASRRFFNAAVNNYHNAIEMFPSSLMASMMSLKRRTFFNITGEEKVVPVVNVN